MRPKDCSSILNHRKSPTQALEFLFSPSLLFQRDSVLQLLFLSENEVLQAGVGPGQHPLDRLFEAHCTELSKELLEDGFCAPIVLASTGESRICDALSLVH
jgi:hypothetical protein